MATNTFPADGNVGIGTTTPGDKLDVVGGGIKWTSSAYTSSLFIQSTANNELELWAGGLGGPFIKTTSGSVGTIDFGLQKGLFNNQGIQISANAGQQALYWLYGDGYFAQSAASKAYFGSITDDGAGTKLQASSIGASSYRYTPAQTPNYVLAIGSDGHSIVPVLNTGGSASISSGTFTPTYTIVQNISASSVHFYSCYYTRTGNIVQAHISGYFRSISDYTLCIIDFSLPVATSVDSSQSGTTTFSSATTGYLPYSTCNVQSNPGIVEFAGYADSGSSHVYSNFVLDFTYSTQ